MIKNVYGLHIQNPLFLSDFNGTYIFSTSFRKINQISWKFNQWEQSCSMRIDGDRKTDRKKLIVALYNFPNAPTMCRQLRTLPRTGVTGSGESRKHLSQQACLEVGYSIRKIHQRTTTSSFREYRVPLNNLDITQLLHQPLHISKIYKIYTLKH